MRFKTTLAILLLTATLGGCMTTEQQLAATERADDIACRAEPGVPYANCRSLRLQYRQLAAQQQAAQAAEIGARLRAAGQALQQIDQPQPRFRTNCMVVGNMMSCM